MLTKQQREEKDKLFKQGLKQCPKCSEPKSLSEFSKLKGRKDGLQVYCKEHTKENWNKPENQKKLKEYRSNPQNKEHNRKMNKIWRNQNKERLRPMQSKYQRKRKQTDINFKIKCNLSTRIWQALKNNSKSKRTLELLGCTIEEFKQHLQFKFTQGMTWDNYGYYGWHVDHIKPCAKFDLTDPKQQLICFNYKNLQPLWAIDNHKKSDKLMG